MKNKKESIVVFEDWFRYARCLNDTEFRTLMNAILQYYKEPFTPQFTGLMLEVWNDMIDDLQSNVQKKQAKRNTMLNNSRTNPKLSIVSNTKPDTRPDTRPDIGSDTKPNIEPNVAPETAGMVDGRLDMVNDEMGNGDGGDWIMMFRQGETPKSLLPKYPYHRNEITSSWMEYMER